MPVHHYPESHPLHHTEKVKVWLQGIIDHLRDDISQVDEPQAQALFETSAEVLTGLKQAYVHYEKENEEAWQ